MLRSLVGGGTGYGVEAPSITVVASTVENHMKGLVSIRRTGERQRTSVEGSTVRNNAGTGIEGLSVDGLNRAWGTVLVLDSVVTDNGGTGITGLVVSATNTDVSYNGGLGIEAVRTKVRGSSVTGNGRTGVEARGYTWDTDKTVKGKASALSSTITGNGENGLFCSDGVKVVGSDVTDNGFDAECGVSIVCADLRSNRLPRVKESTCDTSYSDLDSADWNICLLDP